MKENEPKVKDSQKWWDKSFLHVAGTYFHGDKQTYDRLVSLEAKIELLYTLKEWKKISADDAEHAISVLESELAELVKELKI